MVVPLCNYETKLTFFQSVFLGKYKTGFKLLNTVVKLWNPKMRNNPVMLKSDFEVTSKRIFEKLELFGKVSNLL